MTEPSLEHCQKIVPLLQSRTGLETTVLLSGSRELRVFSVAWGNDIGDDYEHITINVSPGRLNAEVDLFFTDEVSKIIDPADGFTLWMTDGSPSIR